MVNRKEHHDMTDRQRQRDIMPKGVNVVEKQCERREGGFLVMESSDQEALEKNGTGDQKTRKQQ